MSKDEIVDRLNQFKKGDLVSVFYKGHWFVQYVEMVSTPISKKPSIWCIKAGGLPSQLPLTEEGVTWVKGLHESIKLECNTCTKLEPETA